MTLAVGVTGGIGSGKSQVCAYLAAFGAASISADLVARRLLDTDPQLKQRVLKAFGPASYRSDGTLDRKEIAKLIFQDPSRRETLEGLVHPPTLIAIANEIGTIRREAPVPLIAVEAALIFEAGADEMFDYIIVVDSPEEDRIARVMARDKVSRTEVLERMQAQMPVEEKLRKADFVLKNSAGLAALEQNTRFLYTLLLKISTTAHADDESPE